MTKLHYYSTVFSALSLCILVPAGARAADAAPAATVSTGLTDVIVTAQRRREDVRKVPTSISVLSAAALQEGHVTGVEDITRSVPGVSFQAGGGPGLDNIEMRGISSTSGSATVGLYLDDVPITVKNLYNGAVEPRLFDLDRVEILRGPQGTLYGTSSMGGAIRFISNQPNLGAQSGSFSSEVSQTEHGGSNYDIQGVLNQPIIAGKAAIRLGIDVGKDSGFIDNYDLSGNLAKKGVNDDRWAVLRASAKVAVDDSLTITPALFVQWEKTDDTSVFYPTFGLYEQQKEVAEPSLDQIVVSSVTVTKDFGWAQLNSISSYFTQQFDRTEDGTFYNSEYLQYLVDSDPVMNTPPDKSNAIGVLPGPEYTRVRTSVLTQEIRLSSSQTPDSKLFWIAGLFYSDYTIHKEDNAYIPGFNSTFESIYGETPQASDVFFGSTFVNDAVGLSAQRLKEEQYAVFADVSYSPIPRLKATVGVRYNYAPATFTQYQSAYFAGNAPPELTQTSKFSAPTPKVSVTFDATHDVTVYASAAEGYRLGGSEGYIPSNVCAADLATIGLTTAPSTYNSDTLWSYEGGLKGRFFGNSLSVNADAYFVQWSNIQQTVALPTCGFSITTNVGDAQSYGPELEVNYRPIQGLTLGFAGAYSHATLTKVTASVGATAGEDLLNVPEWTATFKADYAHAMANDMLGFVRADYDLTGPSHGAFSSADPDYLRPTYGVLNASLGFDDGPYEVSLFAKNLLDDHQIIQRPSLLFYPEAYTLRPLTAGLLLKAKF